MTFFFSQPPQEYSKKLSQGSTLISMFSSRRAAAETDNNMKSLISKSSNPALVINKIINNNDQSNSKQLYSLQLWNCISFYHPFQPTPTRKSGLKLSAEPPATFMMDNLHKWAVLDQDHQTGSIP